MPVPTLRFKSYLSFSRGFIGQSDVSQLFFDTTQNCLFEELRQLAFNHRLKNRAFAERVVAPLLPELDRLLHSYATAKHNQSFHIQSVYVFVYALLYAARRIFQEDLFISYVDNHYYLRFAAFLITQLQHCTDSAFEADYANEVEAIIKDLEAKREFCLKFAMDKLRRRESTVRKEEAEPFLLLGVGPPNVSAPTEVSEERKESTDRSTENVAETLSAWLLDLVNSSLPAEYFDEKAFRPQALSFENFLKAISPQNQWLKACTSIALGLSEEQKYFLLSRFAHKKNVLLD